jgi:chaperonin GroEL (HSP60 family)
MSANHLLFREAAREKVLRGATALADVIRITLGPKSKCVLIDKKWVTNGHRPEVVVPKRTETGPGLKQ